MKNIKNLYKLFFLLFFVIACEDNIRDTSFLNDVRKPSNIAAVYDITQDNTGLVTITPTANGAVNFEIDWIRCYRKKEKRA